MKQISDFSAQKLITKIVKWGTQIVFLVAIIVMAYLSFVDTFEIKPDIRNITIVALIALVLNWIVWDSRYRYDYDKILTEDIKSKDYSIHRRYYFARKGFKYEELQKRIRQYNQDFVKAWLADVEDITGRTIEQIEKGGYKHNDHKLLIYMIKHRKYPKSGLRTPRDVLYILSVSGSGGMRIDTKKAEHKHTWGRIMKAITGVLSTTLAASIAVTFVSDGWESACLTLLLNLVILFMSLFFGSVSGVKGGKIKLATAEQICELLEEWKNEPPVEEPFVIKEVEERKDDVQNKVQEKPVVTVPSTRESRVEII